MITTTLLSDGTSDFGAAPHCSYTVTMSDMSLDTVLQPYCDFRMTLTGTMDEIALNSCFDDTGDPLPNSTHTYTGKGSLNGMAVSLDLDPDSDNQPECEATVTGTMFGGRTFAGQVKILRTDMQDDMAWETLHFGNGATRPNPDSRIVYKVVDLPGDPFVAINQV